MKIAFDAPGLPNKGTLVVLAAAGPELSPAAVKLDGKSGGALSRALKTARFKGKKDQIASLLAPAGLGLDRLLVVGVGKPADLDAVKAEALGGAVAAALDAAKVGNAAVAVDALPEAKLSAAETAARMAHGARLRGFNFNKYRTTHDDEDSAKEPAELESLRLHCARPETAKAAFRALEKVADGVLFTRELVSEPANVIYPDSLAKQALTLRRLGVKVEVLGEREMKKLGMGALLGVGQGSARESKLVVMQWRGARGKKKKNAPGPLAFVGKGVTFDSGGISIKPAGGMEDMKWDMAGAATVIGLMKVLAGRKAKVDAIGVVGLVENMPSGTAQRPGDVVHSMSGQTIEIINTDAEGRLVLADALWYTQKRFKPRFMIDLATLTGAIVISLGEDIAGLFSNNDELAERLSKVGNAVGEPLWRLPMGEEFDKQLKSEIADMKNTGGRGGGSITAAQFLQRFVNKTPWAHLDIAGVAWSKKDRSIVPKGGSAFGVRLLDRLVAEHYEG